MNHYNNLHLLEAELGQKNKTHHSYHQALPAHEFKPGKDLIAYFREGIGERFKNLKKELERALQKGASTAKPRLILIGKVQR
jgi:hypothetical protein